MSVYKLKTGEPAFEIVDGPLAGRKFFPGEVYAEIPPLEADRFERADKAPVVSIGKRKEPPVKGPIADERA